jgi:Domain of unknown function (DUF1330)
LDGARIVLIEFPDVAAIKACYDSPEFVPLLEMHQPTAPIISLPWKRREDVAMSAMAQSGHR